jgi:hypothetical protein
MCFDSLPNYVRTVEGAVRDRTNSESRLPLFALRLCSFVMNLGHKMKNEFQALGKGNKLVCIFRGHSWSTNETLKESFAHLVKFIFYFRKHNTLTESLTYETNG